MTICFIIITFTLVLSKSASEWVKDGYNLYNRAKYAEALTSYKEALKQEPESFEIHIAIGKCYYKLGDYEEAIIFYNKAIELNEGTLFTAYYNKGKAYLDLKDYREAIDCFDEALKIKPGNMEAKNRKEEAEGFLSLSKNSSCKTWNLEEDFDSSNNNGPWFFGYKEDLQDSLIFFRKYRSEFNCPVWCICEEGWGIKGNIWENTTLNTEYRIKPGEVSFHPGPNGEFTVVRWVSPISSKINIVGNFGIGDKGNVDVYILFNNKDILFNKQYTYSKKNFDLNINIKKADILDFLVSTDSYGYNNTPLYITITTK
jgi:tetratricopeptide (TPR) repeat protein